MGWLPDYPATYISCKLLSHLLIFYPWTHSSLYKLELTGGIAYFSPHVHIMMMIKKGYTSNNIIVALFFLESHIINAYM